MGYASKRMETETNTFANDENGSQHCYIVFLQQCGPTCLVSQKLCTCI